MWCVVLVSALGTKNIQHTVFVFSSNAFGIHIGWQYE